MALNPYNPKNQKGVDLDFSNLPDDMEVEMYEKFENGKFERRTNFRRVAKEPQYQVQSYTRERRDLEGFCTII